DATSGLLSLMGLLPAMTVFFINACTWGCEDILKVIARAFNSPVHVDRYEHAVFSRIPGDPLPRSIITCDPSGTRFHVCERFDPYEYVSHGQENCVHQSHQSCHNGRHQPGDLYVRKTKARLAQGEIINHLSVPLSRHSPLPELKVFVSIFKPKCVIPDTLDPTLKGLHWACI
ncbi:uncharacterized protein LAESUDRAFT_630355, partial [Laetiporus sulphureus 93-53]